MKATVVLLCWLALPYGLFAQGQVHFANTPTTLVSTNGLGGMGLISGVRTFRFGLYTAPPGTLSESLFTLTALATNISFLPGRFSANLISLAGNQGTPIAFQIRAWSFDAGTSYESALEFIGQGGGAWLGQSPIGATTPAVGGNPPPELFGPGPGQLANGMTLVFVPEPSALPIVGVGFLLMFCCCKRLLRSDKRSQRWRLF